MKKQLATWRLIEKSLEHHFPVILLYVLESKRSSPGRTGFFMAVNSKNEMKGSVGGGIMEHKFVEMAKQLLNAGKKRTLIKKQVHDKSAGTNKSGMICSGEQTILLYSVKQKDKKNIHSIIDALRKTKNGILKLSPAGIRFTECRFSTEANSFHFSSENEWLYIENLGFKNHLYLIGGGHCSLALSKLMSTMDFYIHLFDNRKSLHTVMKNKYVQEIRILENYVHLKKWIPSGANNYVVIMTFGYRTDDEALRSIMNQKYKYLGVMGSKTKIEKMFETYKEEKVPSIILQNIHAPVGINIHSQTPEEIAVSIAAQIIKVKNFGGKMENNS